MTCIVGIRDGKSVWMGGDSYIGHSYLKFRVREPKVFNRELSGKDLLIGYAGNARGSQLLRYMKLPSFPGNIARYLSGPFARDVRKAFMDAGYMKERDGVPVLRGSLLVAYKDRLFCLESDLTLIETLEDYQAIGSARELTVGAMTVLRSLSLTAEEMIQRALRVAEKHSDYVDSPFTILRTSS